MPSTLAPNRLSASSRRALSREARPPWVGEVTLSQELRTARLPRPHVLVGYQWSHTGLRPGRKTSHNRYIRSFVSHRRVAREHCCSPAPSERHVNLSVYAAQASPKAPRGTRWGASAPPARYWSGADGRDTPETAPAASCRHLLCLPSQLFRRSRAETPEGSQPAFAWDDLAGGLNPYPLDYRATFASSLILYPPSHRQPPCGGPTPRGGRRAYHVPRMNHGWFRFCLSAGGRNGDGRGWENPLRLATYLLVQASQRLWLAGSHDVYQQFT